ncbi:hypothetical protein BGZ65_010392 [Modicella reniformis]|uniref:Uncharacterized protein n=1 Tax=Modicella reniformis TaxID=1440133 RepID=A0A9P6J698_9FUNG|nr:hypothetical protein BGZ65_010392 [Modicella reniformis]
MSTNTMESSRCTPIGKLCISDSLLQLIPTCVIVFSSLAFISAECGRQDRRRQFNRFSSEVVVRGESLADLFVDGSTSKRLIKPRRTFFLGFLRCLGAFIQIGLYCYLAMQKMDDQGSTGPGPVLPPPPPPSLEGRSMQTKNNDEWPFWLPFMHGIVWGYAAILSIVSLLHPRLSNPYRLTTHLDIIYLTTAGGGLTHFMLSNFGRPIGLWTLDDQISGLSAVVSGCLLAVALATKPLVPPQPEKGPERIISRGVISPETRSSLYARIAFTWLHPMVIKSFKGKLQESDVWAMDKALRVKIVFQDYLENRKPTVFVTMLELFLPELSQQYLWALGWACLSMVPPFVVFKLLSFAQDPSIYNRSEAMFYVSALLVAMVLRAALLQRGLHMAQRIATKAMGMASGLIYEKLSLRKDMDPFDYDITDLMAVDIKHVGQGWKQSFNAMIYPTMFILATIQLYKYIGHSAWAGALAVVVWYPISAVSSYLFSGRFDAVPPKMNCSNALVSDFLANLKAIKFLGWEEVLMGNVLKARADERKYNSKTAQPVMTLISMPLGGDLVHAFVMTIILAAYSLIFNERLTPAVLFTVLVLVDIQTTCINSLPTSIISIKEMLDSVLRINDFLNDDENDHDTVIVRDTEMAKRANIPIIGFVNASFVWPVAKPPPQKNEHMFVEEPQDDDDDDDDEEDHGNRPNRKPSRNTTRQDTDHRNGNWIVRTLSLFGYSLPQQPGPYRSQYGCDIDPNAENAPKEDFVLRDLTLSFPPGQVSLVIGTRRSGKSALLLALIGEMNRTSGKIYLLRKDYYHGKQGYGSDVAYVGQDPWLEIGGSGSVSRGITGRSTIRDTILFGTHMDEERYTQVLRACVLENDLQGFPNADMTIIGDKNVIWSMSLKQRISLARAIYSDVSHILMDDCLSYVEDKSRHFIWKNCILGPLAQDKTRIMVSNQLHVKTYLNDVVYVVGLDQGIVLGHGTVQEILSQGWIRQAPRSSSIPTTIIPGASVPANMGQLPPRTQQPQQTSGDAAAGNAPSQDFKPTKNTNIPLNKMSNLSDYDDLDSTLNRETAASFKVGWATFGTYIFSLGRIPFLVGAFTSLFLSQTLFVARIGWLGLWAKNGAWDGGIPLQTTLQGYRSPHLLPEDKEPPKQEIPHYDYIVIFAALAAVRALFIIANGFFMRAGANKGADWIYAKLLHSIAGARLSVFEVNAEKAATSLPGDAGGLFCKATINGIKDCFQRDMSGLDVKLAKEVWKFSADFLSMNLILVVLVLIIPFSLVPAILIMFLLSSVAVLGLGLSKEMHRMAIRADRMNKDQFKHTFRGLATIRGYGLERRAIKAGIAQAEAYLKTAYFGSCADRWLHWKVNMLSAFIPFSSAVMVLQRIEEMEPILMGLALYMSLRFGDRVLDSLLGYGRIRNRLQWALERTRRYISELNISDNKEGPKIIPDKRPPAGWPHGGGIEYTKYACIRAEGTQEHTLASKPINKAPASGSQSSAGGHPTQSQNPANVPSPSNPLQSNPRDNTRISATTPSVATSGTTVGGHQDISTTSKNSLATTVPLPTPSSTFASQTSVTQDASAPLDQLAALDQTEAQIPPVTQTEGVENPKYDTHLPPVPPSTANESNPTLKNDTHVSNAPTEVSKIGFGPVTCTIQPGEKIAVVGQSKSGKSSFVQSLFRVWETAEEERIRAAHAIAHPFSATLSSGSNANTPTSATKSPRDTASKHDLDIDLGMIKVDGLDIEQIGLGDLRSRFAYLSQRGSVFAGTVRFNLDPHGEHEDAELNDILKTCFLNDRLKLDTELITPATVNLTSVIGISTGGQPQQRPSRLSRCRKNFWRRSHARIHLNKGKGKASGSKNKDYRGVASAPATVGTSSGRGLLTALGDYINLAEVDQPLDQSSEVEVDDEEHEGAALHSDTDDDEYDDDDRVDLDANEKQLLSLARILVQRPNVVTDLTAQRMDKIIFQELIHATILCVSHRLDQIVVRHNRILVIDHGKIVEFDTPIALLNIPNGAFRTICNPNGPNFSSLVSLAKQQQQQP